MSKILKGLNEVNPHNYDSDWDYQDAVAKSGRSRPTYSHTPDDDDGNPFAEYERQQRMFAQGRAEKAKKEKAQRDADHDRLASGTNESVAEGLEDAGVQDAIIDTVERLFHKNNLSDYGALEAIRQGVKHHFSKSGATAESAIQGILNILDKRMSKSGSYLDLSRFKEALRQGIAHRLKKQGVAEEQLDELSNEKLGQYKTAAAADAGQADLAGDYKKADKRFSGIVKATKKQFANDTKTVKEADGQKEFILYINNKPAAKYVDQLQAERDMASVKKKHPQVRIELKHEVCDLETVKKINENQLMGNALIEAKSLLTQLDESTQQQVINALKKNVDDEKGAFKTGYPRIPNPKILGTNNKAKSIYYPPSKPNVKKLDKPLPESLGDQLKSKSIQALQQVKQKLEQQRMADLEQWEKDFKQNTVAKFTARQPSFMQQQPKQIAKPLEKHSVLKARLAQLDKAIEKQAILDKMLQRLEAKGLLTPAIQSDTDTSMLVRDGANDNYVSLNQKLDKALEFVKNRLLTNKAAFAKPKAIDEAQEIKFVLVVDGEAKFKFPTREEALKVLQDYKAQFPKANAKIEPRAVAKTMYEAGTGLDIDRSIPGRTIARVSDKANSVSSKAKTLPSYADREDEYDRWSGKTSASTHDDEEDTFDIDYTGDEDGELDENLHQWFKEKWVRFGPDGKIRGDCARGDDSEGKPKCLPQSKAHSLGKKGRASAAARKRREDPNPERSGKAINVNTKKKTNEQELDEACWKGYHKEGNKKMFGKTYPNCVKNTNEEQELNEFAPDGFNGDDGEEFNPNLAKMAQEDGFTKGASLADGATTQRAMAINDWDKHDGGIYSQHFAKGFIAGRKDKIRHNNKQHNLNLKLMKDGSIRHGEQELDEYGDTAKGQKMLAKVLTRAADRVTSKKADTDPKYAKKNQDTANAAYDRMTEEHHSESCPHCGGEMVSEELMNEKKDACYYKVKSRYKVWPSAYASGALVKCRKKGADSWGNGSKKNEGVAEGSLEEVSQNTLKSYVKQAKRDVKSVDDAGIYNDTDLDILRRREKGLDTAKNKLKKIKQEGVAEDQLDEKWTKKYKDSINCSNPKGFSQKAHCAGKQKNESAILKGLK